MRIREYRLTFSVWIDEDGVRREIVAEGQTAAYILPAEFTSEQIKKQIKNHLWDAIKKLDQPEQKKGKWINPSRNPEFVNKEFFSDCSVCGFTAMGEPKECPNCGANMEAEE